MFSLHIIFISSDSFKFLSFLHTSIIHAKSIVLSPLLLSLQIVFKFLYEEENKLDMKDFNINSQAKNLKFITFNCKMNDVTYLAQFEVKVWTEIASPL